MKSILAIDDKRSNLITITALINDQMPDCKVLIAMSGKEGIEIAKKEQPDTILLDIIMPEMDGFETCKRLKEDALTKHIPVVLITAFKIDTESRIKGLNIGADAFLSKPIDSSELMAQVNVMLRIKEVEDKLRSEKVALEDIVKKRTIKISEQNRKLQREIIERKQTEEKIKNLSSRNQLILDTTMDGYVLTNLDGKIVDVNPAYCTMIGYSKEELLEMNITDLDAEIKPKEISLKTKQLLSQGYSRNESIQRCKNGKVLNLDMSIGVMHINETPMVFYFIRNITSQKYAEKIQRVLLNISNAAITKDNLIELICSIKDELGTVIDTTNFYIALYNDETDTLSLPFIEDEKDVVTSIPSGNTLTYYVIKTQSTLLATKEKLKELEDLGEVGKYGSDSEIWLGVPLKIKGKVFGVLVVQSYTDEFAYDESDVEILEFISEQISIAIKRKDDEQKLKEAFDKATESDRLKSVFLATMTHELRTPLNAVIGFSEIIKTEDLSIDEIKTFNKTINISGNHLLNIVEDIFEITLIETGELKLAKESVSLQKLLNEVHEFIKIEQQNTEKEHIDLRLKIPPELKKISIETDPLKFKQILINLLKNALKFTPKGSVEYGIIKDHISKEALLKFYVKDTGIGIPKNKREIIFEIFRQVEESHSRTYGGTGIGLSIAKKLTELLGGKIWIDPNFTKGSTFYFTIPYKDKGEDDDGEIRSTKRMGKLKNKTILIVEDNKTSSNYLNFILTKSGAITICAENGEIAVASVEKNAAIEVVLMDLYMPVMDGYEATKRIKSIRPDLPVIAQTAFAVEGDRENALEAGCDDYITKPIKKELLLELIKKYV